MAEPIVLPILPINNENQELTPVDASSISNLSITNEFNVYTDFISAYLYDINDTFLRRIEVNYTIISGNISGSTTTQLTLDPSKDVLANGYTQGIYKVDYNFLSPLIENNPLFYIDEISSDRTELRIKNSSFSDAQLQLAANTITSFLNSTETFQGFYLDFGLDNILLGTNIAYDGGTIAVKLYQPLPGTEGINNVFNFVRKISEPVAYSVEFPVEAIIVDTRRFLRGPNLNINVQQQTNNSTEFKNISTLLTASTVTLTDQLRSILVERRAELNTDYSDYNNFVFFSSAQQRLSNFYYKASELENYNNQITTLSSLPATTERSASIAKYQQDINQIITNFDGYDYYLYYESSSYAWPKSNTVKPYTLYSTGSSQVLTWFGDTAITSPYFGGRIYTASLYDEENQNNLYNIYPQYIVEDSDNENFQLFVDMVAQMFDEVWLYSKAVENRQDGDNSLSGGISVDLVADALKSYGINLYESNFTNSDLYTSFVGITAGGSTLPPTGSELITSYVTASADTTPFNDAQKLIYKRLYHNLPYLLKKKGTISGLRVLLNCFGIPDTILRINEFGGKDKNISTWDNWQSEFNYACNTQGTSFISSSFILNSAWGTENNRPQAVEFRFKTPGLPASASYYTQSLWTADDSAGVGVAAVLRYQGTGYTTGSYTGSVVNPNYQYAYIDFIPESATPSVSASVYLPFFNGDWWSILINKDNNNPTYTLYAKNSIYAGYDGNTLGFQASSSVTASSENSWKGAEVSYFGTASVGPVARIFSGSYQEIRYYSTPLPENNFDAYVMNPYSIENSDYLTFRASLGGELYTGSVSIHPKVTGSWATTSSFTSDSIFNIKSGSVFEPNYETLFFDQVSAGIQNPVSDKIKIGRIVLPPTGSVNIADNKTLSPYISIQQNYPVSSSTTKDVNYVEVALSPQNEINEDINSTLGYFNIGEYIGDPRQISSSLTYYPDLEELSTTYFEKYTGNYNWTDYNRLAKYFDNSVFRMIKDFTPARAGLSAGIVIKQHLLERNRQRPAQISYTRPEYTGSFTSLARDYQTGSIEVFTGGDGGMFGTYVPPSTVTVYSTSSIILDTVGGQEFLTTTASFDAYTVTLTVTADIGGILAVMDALSAGGYPTGVVASIPLTAATQTVTVTGSFYSGVLLYHVVGAISTIQVTNFTVTRQSYNAPVITIDGKLGPVTKTLQNEAYYNAEFSGSTIDVVNGQLQDNPLLGQDYLVSIPDLQNLNISTTLTYTASNYFSGDAYPPIPFNVEPYNITAYNNSTFLYTPLYSNIVDTALNVTASFTASVKPAGTQSIYIGITKDGTLIYSTPPLRTLINSGGPDTFSGSFSGSLIINNLDLIPGTYKAVLYGTGSAGCDLLDVTASFTGNTNWTVNTVNLQAQSTYYDDPTVFTQQNFPGNINEFADYNTILNNVYSNRVSTQYFDVDYTSDGYRPVNYDLIISESAIYAQVQDSNYISGSSWFKARYAGSPNIGSYNTSQSFASQSIVPGYPIDNFSNYFLYYDWIGGSDPQYPGGGNLHGVYLVDNQGTAIPLTPKNENLGLISNLFKKGQTATILPAVASAGQDPSKVQIVDGGAIYQTVLYYSGSDATAGQRFAVKYTNDNFYRQYSRTYFTASNNGSILIDGDTSWKWLNPLLTQSDATFGTIESIKPQKFNTQKFFFWNVKKGDYALTTDENDGITAYQDTLLPIQYGDFIRFGTTGSTTGSLDSSFYGLDFVNTFNTIAPTASQTSSIQIVPSLISGSSVMGSTDQSYRIIRRTPTETFVLIQDLPQYLDPGFLIPENYNPAYNVYELATKAGLLQ